MKKYKKEYAKALMDYTKLQISSEDRIQNFCSNGVPSLTKFAVLIGVSRKTLDAWASESKSFALAMEEAKMRISDIIADCAFLKRIDPTFAKYMLSEQESAEPDGGSRKSFDLNITVVK